MRKSTPRRAKLLRRPNLLAGEDFAPMPSQRRSRMRRDALLRAALELFARDGFEAAAIGAIAERAGVAVGGFYQHFRSKRQLLIVLMNELLQKLEAIDMQPSGDSVRGAIESVLRAGLATDLAYAGAYRAWREAMLSDRELAALDAKIRRWTTARLRAVFMQILALPNAWRDIDGALFAALMDRLFWDLLGSRLVSRPDTIETLAHIIEHSLLKASA
jgi:AcrR family transcriptional regulator